MRWELTGSLMLLEKKLQSSDIGSYFKSSVRRPKNEG